MLSEPIPANTDWPRYSSWSFPPYRFVKGRRPHPRRDPTGHSFRQPAHPAPISPEQWHRNEWYLYGIDLYNFAYWWESHEVFEAFWHAAGHHTESGRFFQGLIHVAAANLKRFLGVHHAVEKLKQTALDRLTHVPHHYMGVNVGIFVEDVRNYFGGTRDMPALIRLEMSQRIETEGNTMQYPRSPKVLLGGMAHLPRLIDKIRLRNAGHIPDYNYITTGFDKHLLDLLQINGADLERRVLQGGTDEDLLTWVKANGRSLTEGELREWNDRIFYGGPKDEAARQRFQARLAEIAVKREVPVEMLPRVTAWSDVIELDEGRL